MLRGKNKKVKLSWIKKNYNFCYYTYLLSLLVSGLPSFFLVIYNYVEGINNHTFSVVYRLDDRALFNESTISVLAPWESQCSQWKSLKINMWELKRSLITPSACLVSNFDDFCPLCLALLL